MRLLPSIALRTTAIVLAVTALSGAPLAGQVPDTTAKPQSRPPRPTVDTTSAQEILDTLTVDGEPVEQPIEQLQLDAEAPWRVSYFPYITGGSDGGPLIAFRTRFWQPAEYDARVTYLGAATLDVGIGVNGSRFAQLSLDAPLLTEDWRFSALFAAARETRFNFVGLGNDTEKVEEIENDETQPYFYKVRRRHYQLYGQVTRHIKGPFQVAFGAGADIAKFDDLPGPSVFLNEFGPTLDEDDFLGRLALIYDARNNEFNPSSGFLAEAGLQAGTGGDGYTRAYAQAVGYLPVTETVLLTGRVLGSSTAGGPPLNTRFDIHLWQGPISVLGGYHSNRGVGRGRYVGKGVLMTNVEARWDLIALGDLGALTLLGFVDAGRVFEEEGWTLTLEGFHVGVGGGFAIRALRSTIFTVNFARGSDGFQFSVGSGWAW